MKSVSLVIALYVERTFMLNGSFYRLIFSSVPFYILMRKPTIATKLSLPPGGRYTGTVITAAGRSSIWWMTTTRACHFYGANLMEVWNSSKLYWLSERTARTWLKFELTQRKNISDEKQQRIMPAKHQAPQLQLFLFIFQKIFLPKDIFLKLTKDIFLNLIKDIFSESTTGSPLLVIIRW